jgi:hypothetical protein
MTYDLRRLRLHGLIRRIPRTHRYQVTQDGFRYALFFTRVHDRLLRPGLLVLRPDASHRQPDLQDAFARVDAAIDTFIEQEKLAS